MLAQAYAWYPFLQERWQRGCAERSRGNLFGGRMATVAPGADFPSSGQMLHFVQHDKYCKDCCNRSDTDEPVPFAGQVVHFAGPG